CAVAQHESAAKDRISMCRRRQQIRFRTDSRRADLHAKSWQHLCNVVRAPVAQVSYPGVDGLEAKRRRTVNRIGQLEQRDDVPEIEGGDLRSNLRNAISFRSEE